MSKKNVNVWSNYKIEMPTKELEISTPPDVQNSENLKLQTSEIADLRNSEFSQLQNFRSSNISNKSSLKNSRKRKLSYKNMGWLQLTSYLSPRARKRLEDKAYKEKRDMSLILDELILNQL